MSTINPNAIDPTKPETGEATTASVRANELATQTQLQNAKNDIEALEPHPPRTDNPHGVTAAQAGAEPAGAIAAHDSLVSAHSGHFQDSDVHYSDAPADGNQYARKDNTWEQVAAPGGAGTYNETEKDSVSQSVGRAKLDFRDTGDATVTVTDDPANDRTIISIDATAGGGGGGVGAGTPFVVGDIVEVESAAGDGSIRSTGINTTTLSGHLADGSIHFTEASIDHTAIQNVGTNSHAQIDTHIASSANPHGVTAAQAGADPAGTAAAAVAAHEGAADPHTVYLKELAEDTDPKLGGQLDFSTNSAILKSSGGVIEAYLGPETGGGQVFVANDGVNPISPQDGGILVDKGLAGIGGTISRVYSLAGSAGDPGRQVYVSADGDLYAVDAPEPGWTVQDTDDGNYNLGTGATPGPATRITGLSVNPVSDIGIGDRVFVTVRLYVHLGKSGDPADLHDKASSIEIGFGVDGVHEGSWLDKRSLSPYFAGPIALSFSFDAGTSITTAQTIDVFCRRGTGDDSACNPWVYGTGEAGVSHYLDVGVPGGGGGGGGDVLQGSGGADGEIGVWNSWAGKTIGGVGVAASDLARLSQANIFTAAQELSVPLVSTVTMQATGLAADQGFCYVGNATGNIQFAALTDARALKTNIINSPLGNSVVVGDAGVPLTLDSSAAIARGSNTILEDGLTADLTVGYTGSAGTGKTGAWTPDFTEAQAFQSSGSITPNVPSNNGGASVFIASAHSVDLGTFTGAGGTVYGTEPSGDRIAYVTRDALGSFWLWPE